MALRAKILVLVGPTASGKTDVAIDLAKRLCGEILSADSRQVFRYLDIGTAKPEPRERRAVVHHFVDELAPDQAFNAGDFGVRAREVIDGLLREKKTPVVVGGSGLYIQSLIDGFFEGPGADQGFRERLERRVASGEVTRLIEELAQVDPVAAQKADPTKPRRIIRALEVYHTTGEPISRLQARGKTDAGFIPVMFGLNWERTALYDRINRRCEEMLNAGLLAEVESLERRGYDSSLNALNTVGYAEAFAYRRGEISFEEMVRLFKQNSRRYAKRQLTWFRRDARIQWIAMNEKRTSRDSADEIEEKFAAA